MVPGGGEQERPETQGEQQAQTPAGQREEELCGSVRDTCESFIKHLWFGALGGSVGRAAHLESDEEFCP